jgi:hypothetical protein
MYIDRLPERMPTSLALFLEGEWINITENVLWMHSSVTRISTYEGAGFSYTVRIISRFGLDPDKFGLFRQDTWVC